jgi:hypothetical protein
MATAIETKIDIVTKLRLLGTNNNKQRLEIMVSTVKNQNKGLRRHDALTVAQDCLTQLGIN